jgi:hypothetical protein
MKYWTLVIKRVSKSNRKTACSLVLSLRPQKQGLNKLQGQEERTALFWAASSGNSEQTFRDNLLGPIFKEFFEFLTLEDGTDVLSRNDGRELPLPDESSSQLPGSGSPISRELLGQFHLKSKFDLVVVSLGVGAVFREQIHGLT